MNVKEALSKSRSYRRFYEEVEISEEEMMTIVDAARLSPSGKNIQPLKFFISNDRDMNSMIFNTLAWAGFLKEWNGPCEGERPSAYIITLHDTAISPGYFCNDGITAQSMLLQATELGYGGCIICAVKKEELAKIICIPERLKILMVIAIGKPKEKVVIDEIEGNEYKYWREADGTHHVPKRSLNELIWKK